MSIKKRALVAGGAGFIPSHLCDALIKKGYEVTAIDNLVTGRKTNLDLALKNGLEFIQADINEVEILKHSQLQKKFDYIYNMASPASPVDFGVMPDFILKTSSHGHRHLLEIAKRDSAHILFASSSEVYGDAEVHPQHEGYFGNVNCFGYRSCYDEAKRFGESLSYAYQKQHGVQTRIARIFNTYGPRMRPTDGRIIPNFFSQALQNKNFTIFGDGKQTRSFCYVSDLVDGLILLCESSVSTPTNIGNPIEHTVLEMAEKIKALTKSPSEVQFLPLGENDPKVRRPDISKAQKELGYQPKVSLADGLAHSFEYFKNELK